MRKSGKNGGKRAFSRALCLVGAGLAAGTGTAAARPPSGDLVAATVVIHGSMPAAAAPSAGNGGPGVAVLRGAPPASPPPQAEPACPQGAFSEPGAGCVIPGYAYGPYEYGYWPDLGFYGFLIARHPAIARRRAFPHGFARRAGGERVPRLGFRPAQGFFPGSGRVGGVGGR